MGLFQKNDGGLMDVIRCDEQDYLIWKWHPQGTSVQYSQRANSIRWGSSLRVRDGSVAVFVYPQADGTMQDFIEGPCDQIIETNNFPVLASIIGSLYDGASPFQAEVYFINLANLIQIKFGVPFFDVYDPKFKGFGVPVAVRGSIDFRIADYRTFVEKHRLDNFDMAQFQNQIRENVVRNVKSIVSNAPEKYNIPILQMERCISEINTLVEDALYMDFRDEYGVMVTMVNISDIEYDKTSLGYKKIQSITQNKAAVFTHAAANFVDVVASHRADAKRIIKSTKDAGESAEKTIGVGEMGKKVTSAFGGAFAGLKNRKSTPPPIPVVQYYVAINGKQAGPFDMETLNAMYKEGSFTENSLVWKEGMKNWKQAGTIKDFDTILHQTVQPPDIPNF